MPLSRLLNVYVWSYNKRVLVSFAFRYAEAVHGFRDEVAIAQLRDFFAQITSCHQTCHQAPLYSPSSIPIEAQMNPCTSIRECGFSPRFCTPVPHDQPIPEVWNTCQFVFRDRVGVTQLALGRPSRSFGNEILQDAHRAQQQLPNPFGIGLVGELTVCTWVS